jgi:hypothetical protein
MEYIPPKEGLMRDLEFLCQSRNRATVLGILQDHGLVADCAVRLEDCFLEDLRNAKRFLEKK